MTPQPDLFRKDLIIELRTTPHGGRSVFARRSIPANTVIHTTDGPFAYVIYNDFRKEICTSCYAYAFTSKLRTWSIKSSQGGTTAVFFCSEHCRETWEKDAMGRMIVEVHDSLAKAFRSVKKGKSNIPSPCDLDTALGEPEITKESIDKTWAAADKFIGSKSILAAYCTTTPLEDMELEIARFIASAIVQRYIIDSASGPKSKMDHIPTPTYDLWESFLQLQDNELANIGSRPHLLPIHIRIYAFLSFVLPAHLKSYVQSTVRAVLARDPGNSFGIWEGEGGEEMFGWGMWTSASYFNHNCTPNVQKTRQGRSLHFTTVHAVEEGAELYINYVDVILPHREREQNLRESWFFSCTCQRCCTDSQL
ncbi:hypothetical protein BJ138DRAFT_1053859, partial [Hygrophoropsis aurantiaca]